MRSRRATDLRTHANSGGDVKRGHKWDRKRWKKGASEAAMKRGMYAGDSSRTGISERPEATNTLNR